ncbi:sugar ABC transporter ATP-binding protein [Mesorhizobium sp. RSR380A]|uniref:sugar ABC transporter ATP-binding protein n=1 Tax=unclassified Mesorhizobium TaxID=325217 RepID=UPI0003CEE640|nr:MULTISPECIES: sugar ABC transporter ATP-binding protein [unclassified Mesorhizobium]ESX52223.1 sugar ABC transporter ATP-binding protein [Mesorhizobium sp. LSHC426A00]ESX58866.1 sugar ABC transporter ATP-binding protein [Mesorhizobium sp. LSHC424B00]ESX76282.1 sugar ABC transporter ATP-binding protein [Mesorhizobium sp. LSHC416B00]ESY48757.1 sugar ABC transporter ATP-binding protein [Mesorhizobium sp. LNJC380A00]ESZ51371.1 sugar ABC transporter ATP-binding protein [Mesorhizobium sp. L2C054A
MGNDAVFRVDGLRKSFGHIEVLGGVSLELHAGEITVLMGANGAGKSTLVKIISGVYDHEGGIMHLAGGNFAPNTPAEAIRAGVVTVHQNINDGVVADLDVATNLTLDRLTGKGAPLLFNPGRVRREAKAVADRMGLAIDLKARISDLSLADRQMVAIARAMAHQPKVLILDEPTSSLSSAEADRLFALLDRLREQGVAILYISHRMSDIRRLADRIVSMRDGVISGVFDSKPLDYEGAVNAMLGRKIHLDRIEARSSAEPILTVDAFRIAPGARPFSLTLGDGEVVAITGLVGVGKTALAETLFGLRKPLSGTMTLYGKPYAPGSTGEAIAAGVFLVAKDRGENGIVGGFNIQENISLPFHKRMSRFSVLKRGLERTIARRQIEDLGIVCRSEKDDMTTLSGGNQQKVMVARWMAQDARLFILDEPFQGVDISARRDIAAKLRASANGRATLLFVTELDEALETADRILVMSEQTIVGEHRNADVDLDRLLAEVAGGPLHSAA